MKTVSKLAAMALGSALIASPALAVDELSVTFAQFTQQTSNKIANYTNTGSGNTLSILESPAFFVVQAFGPLGFYSSTVSMLASSTAQVTSIGQQFEQRGWNGSMLFGNGQNYLTVNFSDATFSFDNNGGSASMISTDPSSPISYSSSLLDLPTFDLKNFSLSFTGITPAFSVDANGYGTAFNANIAGSFAGSVVPEPGVWAMLVLGFGLTGAMMRRRQYGMKAVSN